MTKESQSQPEMVFDAILMALPVLLMIQIIAGRYQHVGLGNRAHVVEIFNPNLQRYADFIDKMWEIKTGCNKTLFFSSISAAVDVEARGSKILLLFHCKMVVFNLFLLSWLFH